MSYKAVLNSDTAQSSTVDLELVKAGGQAAPNCYSPDLAVFRIVVPGAEQLQQQSGGLASSGSFGSTYVGGSAPSPAAAHEQMAVPTLAALPAPLAPAIPAIGDKAYIVARTGANAQLNFTDGLVSSAGLNTSTTTAYADNGYSGAPVVSVRGFLLGVVVGGQGSTIEQTEFIPANSAQYFLVSGSPRVPGLPVLS